MNKYTVDRIEGEYAVLLLRPDEKEKMDVAVDRLPVGVNEGDILAVTFTEDGRLQDIQVLKTETDAAKKRAENLIQKLIDKNKK